VYLVSGRPTAFSGADANPSGAPSSLPWLNSFERITLCGQTKLQLPHWMHESGSHTATSSEMFRFS
jgi:hypothetical protein